jgi:dienelactone hydrolase
MSRRLVALAWLALSLNCGPVLAGSVTQREIHFYSEGVLCYGRLYLPENYGDTSKVAAVVLAPGMGLTSTSVEKYAADIAAHGMLAMAFDYRGWGKSGGFLYFGEPVQWDDRLRFSQTTTKMIIRRKRIEPQLQLTDIRNALTYLEGEPGVDRGRIGVWGTDLSGGHAVVVAGTDARAKAIVAQLPALGGKNMPRGAFAPDAKQQASLVGLARSGAAPTNAREATTRNAQESKLALAEYHPFWYLDQIAPGTAVRFIVAGRDSDSSIDANATAASALLKGPVDVLRIPDARHLLDDKATDAAIRSATEWFAKNL